MSGFLYWALVVILFILWWTWVAIVVSLGLGWLLRRFSSTDHTDRTDKEDPTR